ncbi:unnamed protein product, partial [marine sediment metagenome]
MRLSEKNLIYHKSPLIGIIEFVAKVGTDIYYKSIGSNEIYEGRLPESSFKPIPLSEDWLLNLGFYLENSKDRLSIEAWAPAHPSQRFNIDFKDGKILLISRYQEDNDNFTMPHIKYVHQLQNLFFALTDKELNVIV